VSGAEQFEQLRPLLFSIAYRLLGRVSEAEDAVQETWLRWAASGTEPTSAKAYLSAAVTRVSLNMLTSARARREQYVGSWFPEPLVDDPYEDPERAAELADSVSMAALVLLERLSPLERAVFVLREVFGFDYADVASAVNRTPAACRQLAARAREHMEARRPRFEAERDKRDELAREFFTAFTEGRVDALRDLLAADVDLVGDNGGKAPLFAERILGAGNVARLLGALVPAFLSTGGAVQPRLVNGQPGAILRDRDGRVLSTFALDIVDSQVETIRVVINPDKLRHLGPVGDAWAVLRETRRARSSAARQEP
jgi:RNA polymerase sigma-70 factor (ECF subfamily)